MHIYVDLQFSTDISKTIAMEINSNKYVSFQIHFCTMFSTPCIIVEKHTIHYVFT